MKITSQAFTKSSKRALKNAQLQDAIALVSQRFSQGRRAMVEQTPDWEELRAKAEDIKNKTLQSLPSLLQQLELNLASRGGIVYRAVDSNEAIHYLLNICRRHKIKLAVKSKSMVSEEIGLNDQLQKENIQAIETDLGEFIIQLAKEPPFHIIVPAVHKTRSQISELFHRKLHAPLDDDIQRMTQLARETLRSKFLEAGLGISGVNFAVAETGTLVVVENEGNARMCTTVPKVHVAIMGMEKVIPRLSDLGPFLTLLPRNATGQRMSSYVSWINGPRRKEEPDGPELLYLIILDNGRSKILADPEMQSTLRCIRCGACLNHCPIYRHAGGHAYGWVYPGPIGSILNPQLIGLKKASVLPFASSLCGACADVCPVKIPIPQILLTLRHRIVQSQANGLASSTIEGSFVRLWSLALRHPGWRSFGLFLTRPLQKIMARNGQLRIGPFPLSRWTRSRDFPMTASRTFSQWWVKRHSSQSGNR